MNLTTAARRVLSQLRQGPQTIDEIGRAVRLTPNAVRNQLSKLRNASFVAVAGRRPGTSKPAVVYAITVEGQAQFSTIYLPVLTQFLRVAEYRCSEAQLRRFMSAAGKSLGRRYDKPVGSLESRVRAGARLLGAFGGTPRVTRGNGTFVLRSGSCPLAALTTENSAACQILVGLFAEYVGAPTKVCCTRDPEAHCCFEVAR